MPLSEAQAERQDRRNSRGQYTESYRCELCQKKLALNKYYSDNRCNTHRGYGLILCRKCAGIAERTPDENYIALFTSKETAAHEVPTQAL